MELLGWVLFGVVVGYYGNTAFKWVSRKLKDRRRAKAFARLQAQIDMVAEKLKQAQELKQKMEASKAAIDNYKEFVRGPRVH